MCALLSKKRKIYLFPNSSLFFPPCCFTSLGVSAELAGTHLFVRQQGTAAHCAAPRLVIMLIELALPRLQIYCPRRQDPYLPLLAPIRWSTFPST